MIQVVKHPTPLEKDIERKFVHWAQSIGCLCLKLNVLGRRSWPDRMVIMPNGKMRFIEFKRPGAELSPGQVTLHEQLKKLGHNVFVCHSHLEARANIEADLGIHST